MITKFLKYYLILYLYFMIIYYKFKFLEYFNKY